MGGTRGTGAAGRTLEERAETLHRRCYVFDGHNDLALRVIAGDAPSGRLEGGHMDLPRMREGGLDGGVFAVWIDPDAEDALGATLERVGRFRRWLERTPGIRPVLRAADLSDAEAAGEVAAVVGVEGGYAVREELAAVDRLFDAGVRCLTLTWMRPTAWADAAGAEAVHGGLTRFGARVVERLHALGVLVDVSHASDAATRDVLAVSERPVVASHSGVRSVADHPRNLPDELLAGIAARGGLVGINFFPGYLDAEHGARFDALRRRPGLDLFSPAGREAYREATAELEPVTLERVAKHAARALAVGGDAAVGLGSDFDGVPVLPEELRDVRDLPAVTRSLLEAGIDPAVVRGVLGDNFLRVLREVLP